MKGALSFFLLLSLMFCGGQGDGKVKRNGEAGVKIYENVHGEGLFPIISPCLGEPNLLCVYFSDPTGAVRVSPIFSESPTSTYAFIPEQGNRAIPVLFSPSLTATVEVQGDIFSRYRVMNVSGDFNSSEFVKFAFGKHFQESSVIVFSSPENVIYIVLSAQDGRIKRKVRIPGFFNNYLDLVRKRVNAIEILDEPGMCIDIEHVGRLLLISHFSAGFRAVKFIAYDIIDEKIIKEFIGWSYAEFSTYPNSLENEYYFLGLTEPALPSSETLRVIPEVPFGFIDERTIWIQAETEELQTKYNVRYVKPSGDYVDACSVLWWKDTPAVFFITGNKLKVSLRLSDWNWQTQDIDENVFGDISSVSVHGNPCVIYSKVGGLYMSCDLGGVWKSFQISRGGICSSKRAYFDMRNGNIHIACVSLSGEKPVGRVFSVDAQSILETQSSEK